ncbi:MAG: rod shape-determining protein MreC [Candidatus Levyibacteriota bacterium]
MKRKTGFLPVFFTVVFLCILILVLSLSGKLKSLSSFLEKETSGIQTVTFRIFQRLPFVSQNSKIKEIKDENLNLLGKITDYEKLRKENAALSDQFQTSYPQAIQLLKVDIIGAPAFIPGVSVPDKYIINKGQKDNLKVGMAVIFKNNLVGIISKTSTNLSEVATVNDPLLSFTAKTQNGAIGIVRGEGLTLDNILLSENISDGEFVLTKGDIGPDGVGIPPGLMVGKIISVEKKPSSLFQKAKIESLIDFTSLSSVFVYMQTK